MNKEDEPYVNPLLAEAFGNKSKKILSRGTVKNVRTTSPPALKRAKKQQSKKFKSLKIVLAVIIAVGLFTANPIYNVVAEKISESNASVEIKDIAKNAGFNQHGKLLFFRASPELVNADELNSKCPSGDDSNVEFGCYLPNENKIYILQASDSAYVQEEYTTAAHETLHAAWIGLDSSKRDEITKLLKQYYNDQSNTGAATLRDELKSYVNDEAVIDSELHSFVGSEYAVADISSGLSSYYSSYFANQSLPVNANVQFDAGINNEISNLNDKYNALNTLSDTIDSYKAQHLDNIQAAMARDDYLGDYHTYNLNVDAYNKNLVYYNSQVDQFNSEKDNYNNEVDSFNGVLKSFYPTKSQVQIFTN